MRPLSPAAWLLCGLTAAARAAVFDVTNYGAKGDNTTDDTAAVRAAFAAARSAGGGTVLFPMGKTILTGPMNVSSHTEVVIETGATVFGHAKADWPIIDPRLVWPQYGNGGDCFPLSDPRCYSQMHQPFLFSWNTVNVTVRGAGKVANGTPSDGVIDGHGSEWWGCAGGDCPHVPYCSNGAKIGTPGSKTCPLCPAMKAPCNGVSRPKLIMMANVTDVRFLGVRIQFAPDWTLHFSSCTKVHVDGCWVHNGDNPNGDGIDIDSTQDFIVENSYIDCEDDSLCVKSGLDALGRAYARPSRDGVFRNNHLGRGGGLTIGSEGSGGVFNITYENLTMNGTMCGVHIKSRPSRGGVMDGIYYRNIRAHNVRQLFSINMGGECRSNASGFCSIATKPQLNNLLIENVSFTADSDIASKASWGGISGEVDGGVSGIQNVTMRNVLIDFPSKWASCDHVDNGVCEGTTNQCPSCFKKGD